MKKSSQNFRIGNEYDSYLDL